MLPFFRRVAVGSVIVSGLFEGWGRGQAYRGARFSSILLAFLVYLFSFFPMWTSPLLLQAFLDPIWGKILHLILPFLHQFLIFSFLSMLCCECLSFVVCFGQFFLHCAVVLFDGVQSLSDVLKCNAFQFADSIDQFLIFLSVYPNSSCNTPFIFFQI